MGDAARKNVVVSVDAGSSITGAGNAGISIRSLGGIVGSVLGALGDTCEDVTGSASCLRGRPRPVLVPVSEAAIQVHHFIHLSWLL